MVAAGVSFCVAHLYSPAYFLPVVSAIVDQYGVGNVHIVLIIHAPGQSTKVRDQMHSTVSELAKNFSNIVRVVSLSDSQVSLLCNQSPNTSYITVHQLIGSKTVHEFYYSHDFSSHLPRIFHALFPSVKMICTGDALGIMYDPTSINTNQSVGILRWIMYSLRRCVRALASTIASHRHRGGDRHRLNIGSNLRPTSAVLILPIDATGGYIDQIPFKVCRKKTVLFVASQCANAIATELQGLIASIDKRGRQTSFLLLLENHADARHMTFESEIDMYAEIIRRNCTPGALIVLKPHPGERKERGNALLAKLKNDFEILILPEKLKRYPVEVLASIVERTQVIATAFPVISLRYLYGANVIQPFDDEFVVRWFPARIWPWLKDAHRLYTQAEKNLRTWDSESILWSASQWQNP